MVARAESIPGLGTNDMREDCNPRAAETFQVEEYLLEEVRKVLRGEKEEAVIANYKVDLRDGSWSCQMPEKITVLIKDDKKEAERDVLVSERQWIGTAGVILSKLGHNLIELHEEYGKDLNRILRIMRRGRKESPPLPVKVYNLRGELFDLAVGGQFEIVLMGTPIKKNRRGWRILLRRKVDEVGYNESKAA